MRFYFENTSRPKRVAEAIRGLFPLYKLSQAQDFAAKIYGYRDWHELDDVTRSGRHKPSPYDEDSGALDGKDRFYYQVRAAELLGLHSLADIFWIHGLNLTSRRAPFKPRRFGGLPKDKGLPFFKVLQTDLLHTSHEGEASMMDDRHAFAIPPIHCGTVNQAIQQIIPKMRRQQFYGRDGILYCEQLLNQYDNSDTVLSVDDSYDPDGLILTQTHKTRTFVYDEDWQVKGFVLVSYSLRANQYSDTLNELDVNIVEAWAAQNDNETWSTISNIVESAIGYYYRRIEIACTGAPEPINLEIMLGTESEFLTVKNDILPDIRDMFCESCEMDTNDVWLYYDI